MVYEAEKHKAEQERLAKERLQIIEWISPLNFFPIQEDLLKKRQEGTGEWLLNSDPFVKWVSRNGQILWCPGIRKFPNLLMFMEKSLS
jgi:hypothetical protein